jgi:hypothetical protein
LVKSLTIKTIILYILWHSIYLIMLQHLVSHTRKGELLSNQFKKLKT